MSGGCVTWRGVLALVWLGVSFVWMASGALGCTGRVMNPVTDVCWSCLFPIQVAGSDAVSCRRERPANGRTGRVYLPERSAFACRREPFFFRTGAHR